MSAVPVPREEVGAGISTARLRGGGNIRLAMGFGRWLTSLILSYLHSFLFLFFWRCKGQESERVCVFAMRAGFFKKDSSSDLNRAEKRRNGMKKIIFGDEKWLF